MLIVERCIGQAVVLKLPDGREVRVVFLSQDSNKARLGIEADRAIPVYRDEIRPPTPEAK